MMRYELFVRATKRGQKSFALDIDTVTADTLYDMWDFFENEYHYFEKYPTIYEQIPDIANLFADNQLAQTLLVEFENSNKNSIIPAMLYWLYFSQSFERMVEKGEELRRMSGISYVKKFLIKSTIRLLRNKSISLGPRTKADWKEHYRLMQQVDSVEALDLEIDVI